MPQSLRQQYTVGSTIESNLVWMSEREIEADFGSTAGQLKIPTVLQLVASGVWERGAVLKDPNNPYRRYKTWASTQMAVEEEFLPSRNCVRRGLGFAFLKHLLALMVKPKLEQAKSIQEMHDHIEAMQLAENALRANLAAGGNLQNLAGAAGPLLAAAGTVVATNGAAAGGAEDNSVHLMDAMANFGVGVGRKRKLPAAHKPSEAEREAMRKIRREQADLLVSAASAASEAGDLADLNGMGVDEEEALVVQQKSPAFLKHQTTLQEKWLPLLRTSYVLRHGISSNLRRDYRKLVESLKANVEFDELAMQLEIACVKAQCSSELSKGLRPKMHLGFAAIALKFQNAGMEEADLYLAMRAEFCTLRAKEVYAPMRNIDWDTFVDVVRLKIAVLDLVAQVAGGGGVNDASVQVLRPQAADGLWTGLRCALPQGAGRSLHRQHRRPCKAGDERRKHPG